MFAAVALMVTALADVAAGRQQSTTSSASGIIYGRAEIVENNMRAPLRRATVTLRLESGAVTARSPEPRTTATDADGAYRFDGLPVGNYRVAVEKAGFLCAVGTSGNGVVNFIAERAAALEGRLIEDTGKPFPDLAVTAERLDDASGQLVVAKSYSAKTDDLGRFRIHTIPPGKYRISATPPAPASGSKLYYPGTEKIEDAGILQIAPGQNFENLTFAAATAALPAVAAEAMATQELEALSAPTRGGTWAQITGRVTRTDVDQPIANAAVKLSSSGGVLLRTAWTDGAGQYSFSRVIPGAYQLAVWSDGYARTPGSSDRITIADGERLKKELLLTPLVAIEGRVLDEFGDPAPGVFLRVSSPQATVVNSAEVRPTPTMTGFTDDRGWFRISSILAGNYNLVALPEPFAPSGPAAFPITSTPIQLIPGVDAYGVNLVLHAAPTTVISGTVVDTTGRRLPRALVTLSPILDGQSKGSFRASVNADANGNFVYPHVPAGTYLVDARGPEALEIGSLTITTPVEPFALTLKSLPTARGRVTFDGEAPPEIKPQLRDLLLRSLVRFQPIGPIGTLDEVIRFGRRGVVEPDWTFQITGLSSAGVIRGGESLDRTLARVVVNGRDITDVPYDFQSGDVDGIEVVLTRKVGGITGTVQVEGKAADRTGVFVFGADGDSWPYLSRTLTSGQTNESGVFNIAGLLPGRYFAIALRPGTPRSTPEDFAALRPFATPVVVSVGADTAIKLTIVK